MSRIINPPQRIQTIFYQSGFDADRLFFEFKQDSVIHSVTSSVDFNCPAGISAFVGGGFGIQPGDIALILPSTPQLVHAYSCVAAGVTDVHSFYSNSTSMGQMLVNSGSRFQVVVQTAGVSITPPATGYFTIAYNAFSEWVNFKEPLTGVRL